MNGDVSLIGSLLSALICMCTEAAPSHHLHSKQLEMALALQLIHNSLQSPASITYKSVQPLIMNLEQPRHVQECTLYRLWSLASHLILCLQILHGDICALSSVHRQHQQLFPSQ